MKKMLLGLSTLAMSSGLMATEAAYVPGEIIVKFKTGSEKNLALNNTLKVLGLSQKREIKLSYDKLSVLKIDQNKSLKSALEILNNNPAVEYAEPNYIYSVNPIKVYLS